MLELDLQQQHNGHAERCFAKPSEDARRVRGQSAEASYAAVMLVLILYV